MRPFQCDRARPQRPAQLDTLIAEHDTSFREQGVAITGAAKAKEIDFPSYGLKISEGPATYEGRRTVLRYVSAVPKGGDLRHFLVSHWASPEGDKEYGAETDKIMNSLGASYDAP